MLCGIAVFVLVAITLIYAMRDVMTGSGYKEIFQILATLASAAVMVFTAFSRRLKIIAAGAAGIILISLVSGSASGMFFIFLLIPAAIGAVIWERLEQEEGFPLFRISYEELSERRLNAEKKTRFRAAAAGTRRVTDAEGHRNMGDLLDDQEETPVLTSGLQGYHARSNDAQAAFSEPQTAGEYGKMEEL